MDEGTASRFVSGGTVDQPIDRDEEWKRAQQELEETRRKKYEQDQEQDGRSLYEVLQANKAAKQEAFEEASRLKNQFRSLDEDEIDFLDSVLESTRAKEAEVKHDTMKQLEAFRRQQEEAERSAVVDQPGETAATEEENWGASRKRKKSKEKEGFRGVKLRKASSSEAVPARVESTTDKPPAKQSGQTAEPIKHAVVDSTKSAEKKEGSGNAAVATEGQAKTTAPVASALGLADYSSDDD